MLVVDKVKRPPSKESSVEVFFASYRYNQMTVSSRLGQETTELYEQIAKRSARDQPCRILH